MCGFTKVDTIRNGVIRDLAKVAPIEDKMRESRLRWFGHVKRRSVAAPVKRRSVAAPVKRCEMIDIPRSKRGKGRPKKSLNEVIR